MKYSTKQRFLSRRGFVATAVLFAGSVAILVGCTRPVGAQDASASSRTPPAPTEEINPDAGKESATIVLAGGCFWCTEYVMQNVKGVTDVVSGYAGGSSEDADYKKVSYGETEHAEAIKVTYDPSKITLGDIFRVFFGPMHDPTQLNRQEPDTGKQYRSTIFYASDAQKAAAESYMKQLADAKVFEKKIATTLEPLDQFYPAEDYHQDYVVNHSNEQYVVTNALPKIEKFKKYLPDLFSGASLAPNQK